MCVLVRACLVYDADGLVRDGRGMSNSSPFPERVCVQGTRARRREDLAASCCRFRVRRRLFSLAARSPGLPRLGGGVTRAGRRADDAHNNAHGRITAQRQDCDGGKATPSHSEWAAGRGEDGRGRGQRQTRLAGRRVRAFGLRPSSRVVGAHHRPLGTRASSQQGRRRRRPYPSIGLLSKRKRFIRSLKGDTRHRSLAGPC